MSHDQKLLDAQIAIEMPEGERCKGQQKEEAGQSRVADAHCSQSLLLRQRAQR